MAVRKEHPVAAYHSGFSRLRRGVHCREFAEDISAANAGKGDGIAPILFVFGLCPQTCERMNFVVGLEGLALSALRPVGKGEFGGNVAEVRTSGEYIDAGMSIRIIKVSSNQILVEKID